MIKVSIIVPVYNSQKYLKKCLDSLVNQTLKDIEIIIINDGSKENEEEIITPYLKKYSNFKYYKKENGGLSSARNYGIKKSSGQYLAFLDSDDYILPDMYLRMYQEAIKGQYDMVVCDINYLYQNKKKLVSSGLKQETKNIKKAMLTIHPAAWNKLFKKELFQNQIYFKEGVWFEDVEFIYRLLPFIKNIGVVKQPFYQYIQRENSITHTASLKINDYLSNFEGIITFYKTKNIYQEYIKELEYIFVRYIYATYLKQALQMDYKTYKECVNKAINLVKKNFPNYKKNKYFYKSIKGFYLLTFNKIYPKLLYKYQKR